MDDSSTERRLNATYFMILRQFQKDIDRAGDTVGPNNMALSNLLWRASSELDSYIKEGVVTVERQG